MLSFVLLRIGLYPVPVDSVKEALEKIEQPDNNIALAIIDTGTHDMNISAAKKLYRSGKKSNIPLVAMLAKAEDQERFAADFAAMIVPPVDSTQLGNLLQKYLPSQVF